MEILRLDRVTKKFGGINACHDVSFSLAQNRILGLIGPNGAGKTTIFNLITGVYQVTAGDMFFKNRKINGIMPNKIVNIGIARTFQNIRLFKNLSALENVCIAVDSKRSYTLMAALFRLPKIIQKENETRQKALTYLEAVGLGDKALDRADSLPYGLQRKLEIARALALEPQLLLLDEPAAGMNPEESRELVELIRAIHLKYHLTTMLIDHHMDVVMGLCDQLVVLNFGEKLAEGIPYDIQNNPEVLRAYLGEEYKYAGG